MAENILEVRNLKKYFKTPRGMLHAVDDVSFTIEKGHTLGIVGESGCGKTTTGRCILRLVEPTSGEIFFEGKDIMKLNRSEMKHLRKDMQIIFQDPFSSLDPRYTINQTLSETLRINKIRTGKKEIEDRVLELMETVGLAERLINTYPHELDGGRRQRIGIARALAMEPKFIVRQTWWMKASTSKPPQPLQGCSILSCQPFPAGNDKVYFSSSTTSIPMLRAVPAKTFTAASRVLEFMSAFLISAICSKSLRVTFPATSRPGVLAAEARLAAFLIRTAAGADLVMNVKDLSW